MFQDFLIGSHAIILINNEVFRPTWKGLGALGKTWLLVILLTGIIFFSFLALESNSLEIKVNYILKIFHISIPLWEEFL